MKKSVFVGAAMLAALVATSAQAGVDFVGSKSAFLALGSISESFDFSSYDPNNFAFPGDPFTVGSVTFTSGLNIIVGQNTGYGLPENTIAYDFWSPMTGSISGSYDLLGFNLGTAGGDSQMSATIFTNLGSYTFNGLNTVLAGASSLAFNGFHATGGEFITGFTLSSAQGGGSAPASTDYLLGNGNGAVPEPASWALMLGGFGLVGGAMRARRKTQIRFA